MGIAAAALRGIAVATPEGDLLGSEDDLVERLKVARVTVRQAARLLEREGLLRVRRGINGGYFSARPSVEMVESIVCGYLNTLGLDARHSGLITTALWTEVLREAARADRNAARALAERLTAEINALDSDLTLADVGKLEQELRSSIFALIDGGYIDVLFRINVAFARQQLSIETRSLDAPAHEKFVRNWKKAKLLELEAIAEGDELLAVMAAVHTRRVWLARSDRKQQRLTNA